MNLVDSFNLDHTKVVAPYVRKAKLTQYRSNSVPVTKWDIRITQPNKEFLTPVQMHSTEHLFAEIVRRVLGTKKVIDFSPMGCRTGFYLTVYGDYPVDQIFGIVFTVFTKILCWHDDMIGDSEKECGNYKELSVAAAKEVAEMFLQGVIDKGFYTENIEDIFNSEENEE